MSLDRIGAIVGQNGSVKAQIEKRCGVAIAIDSKTGDVSVRSVGSPSESDPFRAVQVVTAIARGFAPQRAFRLFGEDAYFTVIDLRDYAGKSESALERIKGRIIGLGGKARRLVEELSGAGISIYGRSVAIIGSVDEVRLASDAIDKLARGNAHRTVFEALQKARSRARLERLKLWEDEVPER